MDDEIIKAAQRYTQVSSHLSQAPSNKEVVRLLDNANVDDLVKCLDTRVEKEREVAEYVRAIFIGMPYIAFYSSITYNNSIRLSNG
jgi:hypothetical protein